VEWLVDQLKLRPGARVLDLGCGPGLYCEALSARGLRVTGVDASAGSIAYARRHAAEVGIDIRYLEGDYRNFREEHAYDAAILVYFDFGVLCDRDRRLVLERIRQALQPRGRFAVEVVSTAVERTEATTWYASAGPGFWRLRPHLVLERRLYYPDEAVSGTEHAVIDEQGVATVYRIWEQHFSHDTLAALRADAGFEIELLAADLTGAPSTRESETLAVIARRDR
jgi:SAM-dependent methyltransferase